MEGLSSDEIAAKEEARLMRALAKKKGSRGPVVRTKTWSERQAEKKSSSQQETPSTSTTSTTTSTTATSSAPAPTPCPAASAAPDIARETRVQSSSSSTDDSYAQQQSQSALEAEAQREQRQAVEKRLQPWQVAAQAEMEVKADTKGLTQEDEEWLRRQKEPQAVQREQQEDWLARKRKEHASASEVPVEHVSGGVPRQGAPDPSSYALHCLGTYEEVSTPQRIQFDGQGVRQAALGWSHCVALTSGGEVWGWGANDCGQLGLGEGADDEVEVPVRLPGLPGGRGVAWVSAGGWHTVVVADDGSAWSCGMNDNGQLGTGDTRSHSSWQLMRSEQPFVSSACGSMHSVLLTRSGGVWVCGNGDDGALGIGAQVSAQSTLTPMSSVSHVPMDSVHACPTGGETYAVAQGGGQSYACGINTYGQCGVGDCLGRLNATPVPLGDRADHVAPGSDHTLWLTSSGDVYSAGSSVQGQCGRGSLEDTLPLERLQLPHDSRAVRVAAGGSSSFVVCADGSVWSCGANSYYQLGHHEQDDCENFARVNSDIQFCDAVVGKSTVFLLQKL